MHNKSKFCCALLGMVLVLALAPAVQAQLTNSGIVGTVTDQSGAVMPGVKITITNVGTGVAREAVTDAGGNYGVFLLPSGTYKVVAAMTGFKEGVVQDVLLRAREEVRRDFAMEVGAVTQQVTVQAHATNLGTENANVAEVITEKQITGLPLNQRRFMELVRTSTGVAASAMYSEACNGCTLSSVSNNHWNAVSISGAREFNSSRPRIDGITATTIGAGPNIDFDVEAVAEFKIERGGSASAETAADITVISKSGTNAYHGSAYEFIRNEKMDAMNKFSTGRPYQRQNQFGASLGGPIVKNKLFFFGNYTALRLRAKRSVSATVPSIAQFGGDLSGLATAIDPTTGLPFPNNVIPTNRFSVFAQKMAVVMPKIATAGAFNGSGNVREPNNQYQWSGRVDWYKGEKDRFFARLTWANQSVFYETQPNNPYSAGINPWNARNVAASWDRSITPRLMNSFKAGLSRNPSGSRPFKPDNLNWTQVFGFKNLMGDPACTNPPTVSITGYSSLGGISGCGNSLDNQFVFADSLTYIRGRHTLSAGVHYQRLFNRSIGATYGLGSFTFNGQYTGNAIADYLLGLAQFAGGGNRPLGAADVRQYFEGYYVTDEVALTPKLRLTFGLRYDYYSPATPDHLQASMFDISKPGGGWLVPVGSPFAGWDPSLSATGSPALYNTSKNNWAPRLGLAYQLSKNSAIRASYGIYNAFQMMAISWNMQGPPLTVTSALNGELTVPINIDQRLAAGTLWPSGSTSYVGTGVVIFGSNQDARASYMQNWTLTYQRTLPQNFFIEAGYIGSKGTHLDMRDNFNIPSTAPPANFTGTLQSRRPFPNFSWGLYNSNRAASTYHSAQLTVKRSGVAGARGLSGLTMLGGFTYAKSLDWDSYDAYRNYIPWLNEYSRSRFDQRLRFTLSLLYSLPGQNLGNPVARALLGHWELSGITTLQSGFPGDVGSSTDYSNRLNIFSNKPLRVCHGSLPESQRTVDRFFDTSCFVRPAQNQIGNQGFWILDLDGTVNQDFALMRNFILREPLRLQFRWEVFNATNHPDLQGVGGNVESLTFGRVSQVMIPARRMQFGLKLLW